MQCHSLSISHCNVLMGITGELVHFINLMKARKDNIEQVIKLSMYLIKQHAMKT